MAFVLIFWLSVSLLVYHLFGYPLLLAAGRRFLARPVLHKDFWPLISVLIATHNEGGVIRAKLLSILESRYPPEMIEVIVAEDGSTDHTVEEVMSIHDRRVILLKSPQRDGKMAALNRAVQKAQGDFLIISDANALLKPDTLHNLMSNFADPVVGCVTGRIILAGAGTEVEANESTYWRYESWIKSMESRLGSTPAADGSLLAVRRSIYESPPDHIINDDFKVVLMTVRQGYRAIYDPTAATIEARTTSMTGEYERKSRIAAGRWQLVKEVIPLTFQQPGFVFKFISHKLLRLLVMFLMILAFISNLGAVLIDFPARGELASLVGLSAPWGAILLAGQVTFYALVSLGALLDHLGVRVKPLHFLYFFVSAQFASLAGLVRFSSGRQSVIWRKAAR